MKDEDEDEDEKEEEEGEIPRKAPVDTASSLLCECKWLISHDMTMSECIRKC